jgi:SAM-dependent methyltransferase
MKTSNEIRKAPPPHARLIQMATGYWVSRMVYAAAHLRLADHMSDGPKTPAELAAAIGAHPSSLHRLMRALASVGVMTEQSHDRFALTPLGEALRAEAPGSARATILALAGGYWWRGWEHFLYCVETGRTAMQKEFGMTIFEYLARHPQEASYFNEAMVGFHGDEPEAVAAAYSLCGRETIVDVGGGTGNLLAALLERHSGTRGVLADLAHVVPEARAFIESRGLADRVVVEATDFFERVPPGGDVYVLSHVIHDWDEDQCLRILGHCRRAIKADGRLLIIEMVLPPGDAPHPGKLLDIAMLVMPGGQERTEEEYHDLLGRAGFHLEQVVPTGSAVSILECVPAA